MLYKFFTNWCLLLYIICVILSNFIKIPLYLFNSVTALVVSCSILGSYMILFNLNEFANFFKIANRKIIILFDIITHWIPLFLVLYYYNHLSYNFYGTNNIFLSILCALLLLSIYIYNFNPEEIYDFSGLSNKVIILIGSLIYFIILIILSYVSIKKMCF
jgi:hypothetical protein